MSQIITQETNDIATTTVQFSDLGNNIDHVSSFITYSLKYLYSQVNNPLFLTDLL